MSAVVAAFPDSGQSRLLPLYKRSMAGAYHVDTVELCDGVKQANCLAPQRPGQLHGLLLPLGARDGCLFQAVPVKLTDV
jgi:hypothetical protein